MLNNDKLYELLDKYPACREVLALQQEWENEAAFTKLIDLREEIPSHLYASCLTILYLSDTDDVSSDTIINAFTETKRDELMNEEDISKYNDFPDKIIIYRGTENPKESIPRLSWSLNQVVAKRFGTAHLFTATILKEQVIAYYSGDEEEILANIVDEFIMLY